MLKRVLLGLLALLALLALAPLVFWRAEPFPAGSESAARLQDGPLPVVEQLVEWRDERRDTPANRDFPGEPGRTLRGRLWYPLEDGPYPLVVHSHGFTSSHRNGAYLARHLASHGYAVVAVDYPQTHMLAPGGPSVRDVVNQPGDVSFLLDPLLARSADPADPLAARFDPGRVAVMGISLGGLTSTLVGFHPQWSDPRVQAVISIAGPTAFFSEAFFAHRRLPFLMLAGDEDVIVPWEGNAAPVPQKVEGGQLITLRGASHSGFAGGSSLLRWMRNPDALGCWSVQRNIDPGERAQWGDLLGSAEIGILRDAPPRLCERDPLPRTLNVLRQQMITTVAVRAFLDSVLSLSPGQRDSARRYLREVMPRELAEVDYRAEG
jgi:predicted dienelactone hydrolase